MSVLKMLLWPQRRWSSELPVASTATFFLLLERKAPRLNEIELGSL